MTVAEALFIAAIVLFVLAVICIGLAVFIFFARNIPDVRADLSGKKRAEAVARIESNPSRERRRGGSRRDRDADKRSKDGSSKAPDASGRQGQPVVVQAAAEQSGGLRGSGRANQPIRKVAPAKAQPQRESSSRTASNANDAHPTTILPDDAQSTTILPDDQSSTTILPDDSSATTILPDDAGETAILSEVAASGVAGPAPTADANASGAASGADAFGSAPDKGNDATPLAGFRVVKKIVLAESADFVQPNQGD